MSFILLTPHLDLILDNLIQSSENIVEYLSNKLKKKLIFKLLKSFIDLMKKENKIIKGFHGIWNFYNLIRGIEIELKSENSTGNEKVSIIIEYIEKNFRGIEYEIAIDLKIELEDPRPKINLIVLLFCLKNYII